MKEKLYVPASTARVRVLLAVVAVWRPHAEPPQLGVYRPAGSWPGSWLASGDTPKAAAHRVASDMLGVGEVSELLKGRSIHALSFLSSGAEDCDVELLFTLGLPWGLEPPPDAENWLPLPLTPGDAADQRRGFAVRDGWRQLAEETSSALDLLPQVFTMPQMRDTYRAIWGGEEDRNFQRWVEQNPGLVRRVTDEARQQADELARRSDGDLAWQRALTAGQAAARAAVPVVGLAAGVAAGGVAAYWTHRKSRGRPPHLYRRGYLSDLEVSYAPRPAWNRPLGDALATALGGPGNILAAREEGDGVVADVASQDRIDRRALAGLEIAIKDSAGKMVRLVFEKRHKEFAKQLEELVGSGEDAG